MHLLTPSPGFAPLTLYSAAPKSLSLIVTVPVLISLPALRRRAEHPENTERHQSAQHTNHERRQQNLLLVGHPNSLVRSSKM
jgi:hypothetical protein